MMEESHMQKRIAVTSAGDIIAGNVDLLSEILLRLPARSLIRFNLVCSNWSSIIISKRFKLSHCVTLASSRTIPPSGIYFYNCLASSQKMESLMLPGNVTGLPPIQFLEVGLGQRRTIKVTQSLNGLLLFVASSRMDAGEVKLGFVFNPVNKQFCVLPDPYDKYYDRVHYSLIIDPSQPHFCKALCVKRLDTSYYSYVDLSVCALGSNSWRSCCCFLPPSGVSFDSGVFWNGAIHWIGVDSFIYFDANSETVERKDMPKRPQGFCSQHIRYFGEWGGHLHLIQVQSLCAKKFSVLELDKDTWTWSVKYRVHLARLISSFPEMVLQRSSSTEYAFSILSVIRGEKDEDSVLLLTIPGKVVAYNLVRKTTKVVCELPGETVDTLRFKHVTAYPYTESIAPIEDWATTRDPCNPTSGV